MGQLVGTNGKRLNTPDEEARAALVETGALALKYAELVLLRSSLKSKEVRKCLTNEAFRAGESVINVALAAARRDRRIMRICAPMLRDV